MPVAISSNAVIKVLIVEAGIILDFRSQVNIGTQTLVNKRAKSNREVVGDAYNTGSWKDRNNIAMSLYRINIAHAP